MAGATTLCKFRKLLNENGIIKLLFDAIRDFLARQGRLIHGGSIVDAISIEAPASTKNAGDKRDEEMHQVKKGNEWPFGERIHVGTDAGTSYIHSLEVTAAHVGEREIVPKRLREDDPVIYGDAGYTGLAKRPEFQADAHLSSIDYRTNTRNRHHWKSNAPALIEKSRVRSKVEYVFLVI